MGFSRALSCDPSGDRVMVCLVAEVRDRIQASHGNITVLSHLKSNQDVSSIFRADRLLSYELNSSAPAKPIQRISALSVMENVSPHNVFFKYSFKRH